MRHEGTVAIVTGGGGGIGRATALHLAREGAAIGIVELDAAAGRETVAGIEALGGRAHLAIADISRFEEVAAAEEEIAGALGPVTLLVNNAAKAGAGSLELTSVEGWRREIEVNLDGAYHCIRAVVPAFQARGGGAIVNIASVNGLRYFGNPGYSAAKAGMINLTMSVATEYGPAGIRCNAICPGSVRTPSWTARLEKDPRLFERLARWYPLGRVAEPEDVARAVAFLGSDEAGYITGAVLPVDGGLMAGMAVMIDEFVLEAKPE
jgi:NAD(P)-dependent dehydrogenase (short-subunit alcohol dehydrogenase family)